MDADAAYDSAEDSDFEVTAAELAAAEPAFGAVAEDIAPKTASAKAKRKASALFDEMQKSSGEGKNNNGAATKRAKGEGGSVFSLKDLQRKKKNKDGRNGKCGKNDKGTGKKKKKKKKMNYLKGFGISLTTAAVTSAKRGSAAASSSSTSTVSAAASAAAAAALANKMTTKTVSYAGKKVTQIVSGDNNGGKPKKKTSALDALLQSTNDPKVISTVEKSSYDWDSFKAKEGISGELEAQTKGKNGYLAKQDFLARTDYRQFERERDQRAAERSRRDRDAARAKR